jgi:hypothetical protein
VAVVERGDLSDTQSFGGGYDRGVHRAQRQVVVTGDQFGNAQPVTRGNRFDDELTGG